jgi:hypothetical protein
MADDVAALQLGSSRVAPRSRAASASDRLLTWSVFVGFFALYLLSMVDHMLLEFTDSGGMIRSAARMLEHGIGPGDGMHDKWCLGQLLIDLYIVVVGKLGEGASPDEQLLVLRLQSVLPACLGALVPTLVFIIAGKLGYRRVTAVLGALCVGVGTMTWVYVQYLSTEATLGMLLALTIYGMVEFQNTGRARWLALAGFAAGYALLTKTVIAAVLPVLPLWAAASLLRRAPIAPLSRKSLLAAGAALSLPLLAFAALSLWYNHARFGALFSSGYSVERDGAGGGFTTPVWVGLPGLLLSPGKGFFFYNPIALLGLIGVRPFIAKHRETGLSLLAIVCVLVGVHSVWWAWHGDFAWGPRFMEPLTPIFGLFALVHIEHALDRARRVRLLLIAALLQLSIMVQILGVAFDPGRFIDVVSSRSRLLRGGTYFDEKKFPLVDDGFILHFVPYFSPLPGHLWMLRAALADDEQGRVAVLDRPPWLALNATWVPRKSHEISTSLDIWWLRALRAPTHEQGPSRKLAAALGALLVSAVLATVWRLRAPPRAALAR